MVGGVDGLQLDSSSYALRRSARRHFCLGPVFFIIAPSSGKMAGALWPKPQRRWQTVGKGAAFDRPSASAATPKIPPGGTPCSAPFSPALSTSSRLPSESSPTTEKMRAKKLVALGGTPVPLPGKRRGRRNFVCFSRCRACEWQDTYKSDGHP